jgi:opacity protein-like surface antigen
MKMSKVLALITSGIVTLGVGSVASANVPAPINSKPTHNNSFTAPTATYPCLHSGFFGGLKGGYAWAKGNIRQDAQETPLNAVTTGQRIDFSMDGGEVGLFVGYDHYFQNNWVLGVEGGGQWTSLSGEVKEFASTPVLTAASNMKIRVKSDSSFDVALRLGHKVHDRSLWYVKLGTQFTRFKVNVQNTQVNTLLNLVNTGAPTAERNKYNTGLLTGLGAEIPISRHCSVGAEYNFTMYQRINLNRTSNSGNGDFIRFSMRPIESQIVARVMWKI